MVKKTRLLRVKIDLTVEYSEDVDTTPAGGPEMLDKALEALAPIFLADKRAVQIMPGASAEVRMVKMPKGGA